jgi:glycine/sarcosine N-methyltransferase
MIRRWDELVDCRARMQRLGPFLLKQLQALRGCVVLDAAVGIGCELPYLLRRGFVVIGNELQPEFRHEALKRFQAESAGIPILASPWSDLTDYLPRRSVGAILLLGNSIPLLATVQDQERVCEVFRELLVPGGVFIVDHRNFDYILEKKDEFLAGKRAFSGRAMYCGSTLRATPIQISDQLVRIACIDPHDGREIGHCDNYPFRGGELEQLLIKVGFSDARVFFDYEEQPPPSWDFRIIVVRR